MRKLIRWLVRRSGVLDDLARDLSTLTWASMEAVKRIEAIEAADTQTPLDRWRRSMERSHPATTDRWMAELWVGASTVVRIAMDRESRSERAEAVRVIGVFSPQGREIPWGEVVDTLRRLYGGAEVTVPRAEDLEWWELPE